jgi:hypothetical protein
VSATVLAGELRVGHRGVAADLAAWTRLLGHCEDENLRDADPDTTISNRASGHLND